MAEGRKSVPGSFFAYEPGVSVPGADPCVASEEKRARQEDGCILLHGSRPRWIAVNRTTLEIAQWLDKEASIDDTARKLAARFRLPFETSIKDVRYVSGDLRRQGFLDRDALAHVRVPVLSGLFLRITGRCNLSCPHCFVSSPSPEDLDASLILRLIDEFHEAGGKSVVLSGGEPLLHPLIKDIVEHAASKLRVEILTNGTFIDPEWAAFLANSGNVSVQISMDGSTSLVHDAIRGKDRYDQVLRAIGYLQKEGLGEKLTLSATVMNQNLHDLSAIIHQAERLGIPRLRFLPLRNVGRAKEQWNVIGSSLALEDYERFFDHVLRIRMKKQTRVDVSCGLSGFLFEMLGETPDDEMWCPVGRQLIVEVNGDVYPCVLMMQKEFRLGNVFKDSLTAMIHSSKMSETCHALSERRTKIEACASCNWRNFCQGGCMGQALDEKWTIWEPDPFCEYRKRAYSEAFDRFLDDFKARTATGSPKESRRLG